jgi:hypothetical protein
MEIGMSFIKRHTLSPVKLAANRSSGQRSGGAVTLAGKGRAAANVRHGFYSQSAEGALATLGEDEFQRWLQSLMATWQPANALVMRLVHALWRTANLSMRIKRGARTLKDVKNEGCSQYVIENKWREYTNSHKANIFMKMKGLSQMPIS